LLVKMWGWYPPVGVFIGVLGLLGIVVPLFRDIAKIGKWERALWTFVFFALVLLELRSIYHDRDKHDEEQAKASAEQLEGFQKVGKDIERAIAESNRNFNTTIGRTNAILENITGGISFPYAVPQVAVVPMPLIVWDKGNNQLSGVSIKIGRMSDPIPKWGNDLLSPIFLGTIAPHDSSPVPGYRLTPTIDSSSQEDQYWIWLSAQNGTVYETLSFRKSKRDARYWAFKLRVDRHVPTPGGGYDDTILMNRGWTDEPQTSPPQHP
jgi:hypothetical protein